MKSWRDCGFIHWRLRAEGHDCQQGEIDRHYGDAADLGETGRKKMIPTPDSGAPAEEKRGEDLVARLGDEPQVETVKEPALRHLGGEQE